MDSFIESDNHNQVNKWNICAGTWTCAKLKAIWRVSYVGTNRFCVDCETKYVI